ncbi:MAG TPA: hypothetical protein VGB38_02190 [bacterium]
MIDQRMWKIIQKRLGYNDEELERFRNNPRNEHVMSKGAELISTRFIIEVVEAHGCNSRHKKGDKFFLDGYGNLTRDQNPDKICIFAIGSLSTLIFAAQELIYAGMDPNEMRFKSVGCIDVGLHCGGWGKVIMKLTANKIIGK